ncbi:hypothetical protein [Sorangium cellulosum]|uniref:hypothetical protein n=1 Tax=Sorangium cellulosum TaxID=56 RepID=UPI001F39D527|nr:hypothetical protein [Sorangium cellulosum]
MFHIQTEDSGVRHPHIITHLFADGGRILKTTKTSYAEHVGQASLAETVRGMMKEQHKAMFIALRDGLFDYLFDDAAAPPASGGALDPSKAPRTPSAPELGGAPKQQPAQPPASRPAVAEPAPRPKAAAPAPVAVAPPVAAAPPPAPAPTPPPRPAAQVKPSAAAAPPPREPAPASPSSRPRLELDPVALQQLGNARAVSPLPGRAVRPAAPQHIKSEPSIDLDLDALERAAAEAQTPFFQQIQDLPPPPASVIGRRAEAAASGAGVYSNVHPEQQPAPPAPAVAVEHYSGPPGSGRYAASRPASIFAHNRPAEGASIFGDDLISEKSLDEVILSYLAEDLDSPSEKK